MRVLRLPHALALIASLTLAGCAALPSETETSGSRSSAVVVSRDGAVNEGAGDSSEAAAPSGSAAVSGDREAVATPAATHDPNATPGERIVEQLNDATRELATLRANNAKLKAASAKPAAPKVVVEPEPADARLTASFKSYIQFKQELAGFFGDLDKLRADNVAMNAELKEVAAGSAEARASVAKLEAQLRAEKETRAQAEATVAKLREQLRAVADAVAAAGLSFDQAPTGAAPTARLETSRAKLRAAVTSRQHLVKDGDTLESIAERYYGDPAKWKVILEANRRRLPLDGTMPAGLELEIPAP
jgi:phage tail protein X